MCKLLLWGTGERSTDFIQKNLFSENEIVAFVDSVNFEKKIMGYNVIKPCEIKKYIENVDYVIICNRFFSEIIVQSLELGIPSEKIVITDNVKEKPFDEYYEKLKVICPAVYDATSKFTYRFVKSNERDTVDMKSIYNDIKGFEDYEYKSDYFRYRTFEFVSEIIKEKKIEGALAELGVFRGKFSALLNHKFTDKKIYLFDTFEGFDSEEAKNEMENGRCDKEFIDKHKDTSIELMLKNLEHPENAVVCKGFFPDSITEESEKETYAFVSLDVDFEASTYEGLKFFWPRMTKGGYIFLHDYNTFFLGGIHDAVNKYEKFIGQKLNVVPIADRAGTLIIVK